MARTSVSNRSLSGCCGCRGGGGIFIPRAAKKASIQAAARGPGTRLPRSHMQTVAGAAPTASPSAVWVSPRERREIGRAHV